MHGNSNKLSVARLVEMSLAHKIVKQGSKHFGRFMSLVCLFGTSCAISCPFNWLCISNESGHIRFTDMPP